MKTKTIVSRGEKILGFAGTISAVAVQWLVLGLVMMTTAGVVFRYALHSPLRFDAEYIGYINVAIIIVGAGYALKVGSHVRVDIVIRMLPRRVVSWLQAATDILSFFGIFMVLYFSWKVAHSNLIRGVIAVSAMETPLGPVQMLIPLGFMLLLLQLVAELSKSIRSALNSGTEAESGVAK